MDWFFKVYLQQRYEWVKSLISTQCDLGQKTVLPCSVKQTKVSSIHGVLPFPFFLSAQKVKDFFILVEHLPALSASHRKDICLTLVPFIQIVLPLLLYKYKDHSFVKWIYMNFFLSPVECSTINPGHFRQQY